MKLRFSYSHIVFVCTFLAAFLPTSSSGHVPVVLYTDILSGPTKGGENGKGTYLSIFGKNLGAAASRNATKVFIGGAEVENYRYLGPSKGRQDIQQITVQVGALGNPVLGKPIAIEVTVDGISSEKNIYFTPNPGRLFFVDNLTGNDATGISDNIDRPFRYVQTADLSRGLWAKIQPGDTIIMRGRGIPWTDVGFDHYFIRVQNKSGSAPRGGAGTGPITILGYPNEDVFIQNAFVPKGGSGAISAADTDRISKGFGSWVTIANLRIESGNGDGAINTQAGASNWRVVNNELTAASAIQNRNAKAGGISGNGYGQSFLGNFIHDIYCGPAGSGPLQHHGIYVDGNGSYEIAYNRIENIPGGNGFQAYNNGTNGPSVETDNINFHHNFIQGVGKHGINLADGSGKEISVFNNLIIDTALAGIRINSTTMFGARIYNNTVVNTNLYGSPAAGAFMNDWHLPIGALDLRNNIFVPNRGTRYLGGSVAISSKAASVSNNLWFGGRGDIPSMDLQPVSKDPKFVDPAKDFHLRDGSPAIDSGSSAVSNLVKNDFDVIILRPKYGGFDLGAFEFAR